MKRYLYTAVIGAALSADVVAAQTLAVSSPKPDSQEDRPTIGVLSQMDVASANGDSTQLGIQALDLYFNRYVKLYVRSTVAVTEAKADDERAAAGELPAASISALLDPFGGVLNLTAGPYRQLAARCQVSASTRGGAPCPSAEEDSEYGMFLDARGGIKFVNLPETAELAPALAGQKTVPFYVATGLLIVKRPVFYRPGDANAAGVVELAAGLTTSYAADPSLSAVFTRGLLDRATHSATISFSLKVSELLAVTMTATPWSSSLSGQRFLVGVKLLRQ